MPEEMDQTETAPEASPDTSPDVIMDVKDNNKNKEPMDNANNETVDNDKLKREAINQAKRSTFEKLSRDLDITIRDEKDLTALLVDAKEMRKSLDEGLTKDQTAINSLEIKLRNSEKENKKLIDRIDVYEENGKKARIKDIFDTALAEAGVITKYKNQAFATLKSTCPILIEDNTTMGYTIDGFPDIETYMKNFVLVNDNLFSQMARTMSYDTETAPNFNTNVSESIPDNMNNAFQDLSNIVTKSMAKRK